MLREELVICRGCPGLCEHTGPPPPRNNTRMSMDGTRGVASPGLPATRAEAQDIARESSKLHWARVVWRSNPAAQTGFSHGLVVNLRWAQVQSAEAKG